MSSSSQRVIVITGSAGGIGLALAARAKEGGWTPVISDLPGKKLDSAAAQLGCKAIAADVTKPEQIERLASKVLDIHGHIDVWVNNAGVWLPHAHFTDLTADEVSQLLTVNVAGVVYGSMQAVCAMKQTGSGVIVNISSVSALSARPFSALYSATKCAVAGFSRSIREELKDAGIHVLTVYPDKVDTDLFADAKKQVHTDIFMSVEQVAEQIWQALQQDSPVTELVISQKKISPPESLQHEPGFSCVQV